MPSPPRPPKRPPPLPPPAAAAGGALFPVASGVALLLALGAIGTGAILLIPTARTGEVRTAPRYAAADRESAPETNGRHIADAGAAVAGSEAAPDSSVAAEADAAPRAPDGNEVASSAAVTETASRQNETEPPASPRAVPAPRGRPLDDIRAKALILELPSVADAPATAPATLARLQGAPDDLARLELELLGEAANGKQVVLQRTAGESRAVWDVMVQRLDNLRPAISIAQFLVDGTELKFAWLTQAAEPALTFSLLNVSAHQGADVDAEVCSFVPPVEIDPLHFDFTRDCQRHPLIATEIPPAILDRLQLTVTQVGANEGVAVDGPGALAVGDRTTINVLDPEFGDEQLFRIELAFRNDDDKLLLEVCHYLPPSWTAVESNNRPFKLSELSKLATQAERKADRLAQKIEREINSALKRAGVPDGVSSSTVRSASAGADVEAGGLLEKREELEDEMNALRELADSEEAVAAACARIAGDAAVQVRLELVHQINGRERRVVIMRTRGGPAAHSAGAAE